MDLNQNSTKKPELNEGQSNPTEENISLGKGETSQNAQPQLTKPTPSFPALKLLSERKKFYMPKIKIPNLREKLSEYNRVLKVTKKPDIAEFKAIVKASGLGIAVIGVIGFIIAIIVQLIGFS
ncbi:MAG: protein translocase SEC61 complex subunit gamma [Candidatus Nanoarchaeia archaeon]